MLHAQRKAVVAGWSILLAVALLLAGCAVPVGVTGDGPTATILQPADAVRLAPTKHAPVVGLVFGRMRFPVVARAENCEFLQIVTPWWGEAWIVGPPEFATIDNAGCADLPDRSLSRLPRG